MHRMMKGEINSMSEIYNIAAVHHEGNPELKVGIRGKEFLLSLNYDNGTILITDPRTRKKLTLEIEDIITDKIYIKLLDGTSNDESSELAVLTADNFVYKSGISLEEFNTAINSIGEKANRTNTLAGYGIDNAYTKDEIDGFIGSTFTFKGVYETYQELLDDVADGTILPKVGWVYNITTGGGTDSRGIDIVELGDSLRYRIIFVKIPVSGVYISFPHSSNSTHTVAYACPALNCKRSGKIMLCIYRRGINQIHPAVSIQEISP